MYPSRLLVNEAVLSTSLFAVTPSVVPLTVGPATLGMLMLLLAMTVSARSTCSF
jgi:small neutral amino acid transporter SnatA (MarC family)